MLLLKVPFLMVESLNSILAHLNHVESQSFRLKYLKSSDGSCINSIDSLKKTLCSMPFLQLRPCQILKKLADF
jgi:NADPH-dependent 7-cyano-7-deazaguanine reductase QueF-like protein